MDANNTPTVCTDDDIARLEEINHANRDLEGVTVFPVIKIDALLERLKWAEKCAELCATDENCCNIPELGENDISPYYLWRKAAGKEG